MADTLANGFSGLLDEAKRLLQAEPPAEQVIVVKTAKGSVCHLLNRSIRAGDTTDEDAFFTMLSDRGETAIQAVLCMWSDRSIDLPSNHFRRRLAELCPDNKNAVVLLQGENDFIMKRLEQVI